MTGKSYYIYMAKNGSAAPVLPTARNSAAWEADIAVNRLLPPATCQRPEHVLDVVLINKKDQQRHLLVVQR
jgi:hypothetical protein